MCILEAKPYHLPAPKSNRFRWYLTSITFRPPIAERGWPADPSSTENISLRFGLFDTQWSLRLQFSFLCCLSLRGNRMLAMTLSYKLFLERAIV